METALTTALDANIVNVALVVAAIAVLSSLAVVLLGGNIVYRIVGSLTKQINVIVDQQAAQSRMTDVLSVQGNQLSRQGLRLEEMVGIALSGQDILRDNTAAVITLSTDIRTHDSKSDDRSKALTDHLNSMTDSITNLIGDTGQKVTTEAGRLMAEAIQPLKDGLKEIRDSLKEAREQSQTQQKQQAEILTGIETKVELVSEQIIVVTQAFEEIEREDAKQLDGVDGGNRPDGDVSAGDASTSATGPRPDTTGDSSASGDKPTSGSNDSAI